MSGPNFKKLTLARLKRQLAYFEERAESGDGTDYTARISALTDQVARLEGREVPAEEPKEEDERKSPESASGKRSEEKEDDSEKPTSGASESLPTYSVEEMKQTYIEQIRRAATQSGKPVPADLSHMDFKDLEELLLHFQSEISASPVEAPVTSAAAPEDDVRDADEQYFETLLPPVDQDREELLSEIVAIRAAYELDSDILDLRAMPTEELQSMLDTLKASYARSISFEEPVDIIREMSAVAHGRTDGDEGEGGGGEGSHPVPHPVAPEPSSVSDSTGGYGDLSAMLRETADRRGAGGGEGESESEEYLATRAMLLERRAAREEEIRQQEEAEKKVVIDRIIAFNSGLGIESSEYEEYLARDLSFLKDRLTAFELEYGIIPDAEGPRVPTRSAVERLTETADRRRGGGGEGEEDEGDMDPPPLEEPEEVEDGAANCLGGLFNQVESTCTPPVALSSAAVFGLALLMGYVQYTSSESDFFPS
ncbi:MAG: hypothetical protein RLN62_01505 [Rickettsiales bacterium]